MTVFEASVFFYLSDTSSYPNILIQVVLLRQLLRLSKRVALTDR